jgi:hypothetical protein
MEPIFCEIVKYCHFFFFRYYGRRGNDSSSELSISDDDEKDKNKNTNNIKLP